MLRAVVFVSGGGTNLQALLDAQRAGRLGDTVIAGVISSRPGVYALERAGRAHVPFTVISPKDYETADGKKEAGDPTAVPDDFACALLDQTKRWQADMIVLAGYLVVLPASFVHAYSGRILNIHPSLIPAFCGRGYYGLRVHEAALRRGVKVTGATVHLVDEGTDTGPILLQKAVEVQSNDTPESLQKRVMEEAEWQLLPEAVRLLGKRLAKERGIG